MKVILNENLDNLGRIGDTVEVKPGYARNYLLPRSLAVLDNKHNQDIMKYRKAKALKKLELEKLSANELKQKLDAISMTIEKRSGDNETLFGSVTTMEIHEKLEAMGFSIDKKKLHLAEPIKKLGNFVCKIKLIEDIEAELKIIVVKEGGEAEEQK